MIERTLKKLYNNILSPRAYSVLGPRQYARLLGVFAAKLPQILKSRDLRPLDQAMMDKVTEIKYRGKTFKLDLRYCDEHIRDGSFAFGGIREIYVRNCYFKYHDQSVFESARTVVDIGANRGVFSTLMANIAEFVLCVEAQPHFAPVIQRNMSINGFTNYAVERAFVGSGGSFTAKDVRTVNMDELLHGHRLRRIDLLKMDIEGSEFSLFKSEGWLDQIGAISMEVHRVYGNPAFIISKLKSRGFRVLMADADLSLVKEPECTDFIFASRQP